MQTDSSLETPHVKDISKYKSKTSILFGDCLDEVYLIIIIIIITFNN